MNNSKGATAIQHYFERIVGFIRCCDSQQSEIEFPPDFKIHNVFMAIIAIIGARNKDNLQQGLTSNFLFKHNNFKKMFSNNV